MLDKTRDHLDHYRWDFAWHCTGCVPSYPDMLLLCPNGLVLFRCRKRINHQGSGCRKTCTPRGLFSPLWFAEKLQVVTMGTPLSPAVIGTLTRSKGQGWVWWPHTICCRVPFTSCASVSGEMCSKRPNTDTHIFFCVGLFAPSTLVGLLFLRV